MKCEDCNISMIFVEQKVMIGKVWDKYQCPRCKNFYHKAIALVQEEKNNQNIKK